MLFYRNAAIEEGGASTENGLHAGLHGQRWVDKGQRDHGACGADNVGEGMR
jgi:hypothetical protein